MNIGNVARESLISLRRRPSVTEARRPLQALIHGISLRHQATLSYRPAVLLRNFGEMPQDLEGAFQNNVLAIVQVGEQPTKNIRADEVILGGQEFAGEKQKNQMAARATSLALHE